MKKIKWYDATKHAPKENQHVAVLRIYDKETRHFYAFLCEYENGQYLRKLNCSNYFTSNDKLALSIKCEVAIDNVVAWCDANELFSTADDLLNTINL